MDSLSRSFEELVETHKRILYKVCRLYCPLPEAREDLAQEILIQLWKAFPGFDSRARFSTWMYRIALNVAISHFRSESVRRRHFVPGGEHLFEFAAPAAEEPPELKEIYQWIERLDPLPRSMMLLQLEGCSYQETAAVLGLTETNVATKLSRIKARMRQELNPGEPK